MLQGQCLCGAIRYRYGGDHTALTVCHCGMCRRWHGSLGAYVGGKPDDYRLEGRGASALVRALPPMPSAASAASAARSCSGAPRTAARMDVTAGIAGPADRPLDHRAYLGQGQGRLLRHAEGCALLRAIRRRGAADLRSLPAGRQVKSTEHHGRCLCGAITFDVKRQDARRGVVPLRPVPALARAFRRLHRQHLAEHCADAARTSSPGTNPPTRRGAASAGDCGSSLFWEPAPWPACLDLRPARSICRPASSPRGISSSRARATITGSATMLRSRPARMAANPVTF